MSDSLLEHLEKLNDLVQDVIRENEELKRGGHLVNFQGQTLRGARPNRKKLTKREVQSIREFSRLGMSNVELASVYDVNRSTICRILQGVYHK